MVHGKGEFEWQRTASMEAVLINLNRDPKKSRPVSPNSLNPFMDKARRKKDGNRIDGKAAWGIFRQVVENSMGK